MARSLHSVRGLEQQGQSLLPKMATLEFENLPLAPVGTWVAVDLVQHIHRINDTNFRLCYGCEKRCPATAWQQFPMKHWAHYRWALHPMRVLDKYLARRNVENLG